MGSVVEATTAPATVIGDSPTNATVLKRMGRRGRGWSESQETCLHLIRKPSSEGRGALNLTEDGQVFLLY